VRPTSALPSGTITFLFTDVESSTRAWLRNTAAMGAALARHDALIEHLVAEHDGQVVRPRGEGDSRFAVFARASDAVAAACAVQLALVEEHWDLTEPLQVRMAAHTGEADLRLGDYYGPAVNHCARLRAVAHGGQVVVSAVTAELVRETLPTQVSLRDLGLHQLKDLEQPERVWQLVHPNLPADFRPLTSLSARRTNLPIELSSFVGREQAIAELSDLLASARLLTLTGPGGIGKTRLALHLAADALANYPHGVWLVRLDALADNDLVPAAIATVMGIREQPGRSLLETLTDAIGSSQLLLVLDNCEHLIQACAKLAEALLQACPQVQLLATSRESLNVAGEVVWHVPPLSLPEPHRPPAPEQLGEYQAVRLFIERAVAVRHGFAVTNQNAPAVAQVCQRLDGIPLAIELAAARVGVLSVEQLVERLDERFRLLTGGSRTASPCQQTLRAAIDWSYELLSEAERALFRRLAIFAGGWTMEAAEAVCVGNAIASEDVLDRLSSLVNKSLVNAEERHGAERYRLLETIRDYARERLEASGEAEAVRRQHAEHFLALAEHVAPELRGARQAQWVKRLDAEHDNLRAALHWCVEHGEVEQGLRLGGALWRFWQMHGHLTEGRERLMEALRLPEDGMPSERRMAARAVALNGAAAWRGTGDYALARSMYEERLAISRELGDRLGVAESLNNLGIVAARQE
jgi:predicted ATPase/class 3 adenylate cyclase